jgi:hypothetical protein
LLHRGNVEPAADLIRPGDREAFTGSGEETAAFEFFLQCPAFGLCAFEQSVSMPDRVGESFVGEIVEFGCGIGVRSLSHDQTSWLGLGLPWCCEHLGGPTILCYL